MRVGLHTIEFLSLAWWCFALGATFFYSTDLPRRPLFTISDSCYLTSDWFEIVECGSSGGRNLLGGLLTWAMLWTKNIKVLMDFGGVPAILIWSGSVYLASRCILLMSSNVFRNSRTPVE